MDATDTCSSQAAAPWQGRVMGMRMKRGRRGVGFSTSHSHSCDSWSYAQQRDYGSHVPKPGLCQGGEQSRRELRNGYCSHMG